MASPRNKTTKKLSMKQLQAANERRKLDNAQQAAEERLAKSSRFRQRARTALERHAVDPAELEDTPDPDDDEITGLNGAAAAAGA